MPSKEAYDILADLFEELQVTGCKGKVTVDTLDRAAQAIDDLAERRNRG